MSARLLDARRRIDPLGVEGLMTREKDTERVPDVTEAVDLKARAMLAKRRNPCRPCPSPGTTMFPPTRVFAVWLCGFIRVKKDASVSQSGPTLPPDRRTDRTAGSWRVFAAILGLRDTYMDAVLVEGGFLTNPEEEATLMDDDFLRQRARGAAIGVVPYPRCGVHSPRGMPYSRNNNCQAGRCCRFRYRGMHSDMHTGG